MGDEGGAQGTSDGASASLLVLSYSILPSSTSPTMPSKPILLPAPLNLNSNDSRGSLWTRWMVAESRSTRDSASVLPLMLCCPLLPSSTHPLPCPTLSSCWPLSASSGLNSDEPGGSSQAFRLCVHVMAALKSNRSGWSNRV